MRRLVACLLWLGACASGVAPASPEDVALHQAEAAATAEVNRHWVAVTAAATLDDVRAELARHQSAMAPALDGLEACLAPADRCVVGMAAIDEIEAAHAAALAAAADLAAARAEVDAYARRAGAALRAVADAWDACT